MDSASPETGAPTWQPRQVIWGTLMVAGLLAGLLLLYRFRTVALMLFVAILFGTGLKPAVSFLARKGISRLYGQLLLYAVLIVAFWGFVFLSLTPFLEQSTAVTSLTRTYYNDARQVMLTSQSSILRNLGVMLSPNLNVQELASTPQPAPQTPEDIAAHTAEVVARAFGAAGTFVKAILFVVAVSLLAFYWTLESERAIRTLLLLFPSTRREGIREVIDAIEGRLGSFLLGQGLLMLAIGVLSLVAFLIIGLPNALVLALIAGVMEAVPMVGPVLGAVPAILVAASSDPSKIIWVIMAAVVIQLAENNLLVPRIMDRSVGVNPILTLLSIATLSSLMGLAGALLAVPIAAIFQFLINRFVITPMREPDLKPEGRDYLSYLRLQAQEVAQDSRKQLAAVEVEPADDSGEERIEEVVETLASELDQILAQVPQAGQGVKA